jgi:7-keto-8-aminopelargonate synthetase-like enzyme
MELLAHSGGELALFGREVDLVMGSFSKTFASNGGFLATHSAAGGRPSRSTRVAPGRS